MALCQSFQIGQGDGLQDQSPGALICFYQMISGMRRPERADDTAAGTMPARAHRLCEAMRSASAFGWYLYPPIDFKVMWDGGSDIFWTHAGTDAWHPIRTVHFPGFAADFSRAAPADLRPFVPPFLAALKEPGILQVWSGVIARTARGWSLLVRCPANLAHSKAYDFLEGMIKTDIWFGPLFTTIRLTRTGTPIEFSAEHPFLQVQPVHRALCYDQLNRYRIVPDMRGLTVDDWAAFRGTVIQPNNGTKTASRARRPARRSRPTTADISAYSSAVLGATPRTAGTGTKGTDAPAATKSNSTTSSP